jgi:hypothetical protein
MFARWFYNKPHGTRRSYLMIKRFSVSAVICALAASLVGVSATEANAYPRVNKCGSGYSFLRSWEITDNGIYEGVGFIDIYYNSAMGFNCAIARGNDAKVTQHHYIAVAIRRSGDGVWIQDGDDPNTNYTSYAGPVYAYGRGGCIDFAGELSYSGFSGHGKEVLYNKHCG